MQDQEGVYTNWLQIRHHFMHRSVRSYAQKYATTRSGYHMYSAYLF